MVNLPIPKRTAECAISGVSPSARRTWLGSTVAEVQADPVESAISGMDISSASASTPAKTHVQITRQAAFHRSIHHHIQFRRERSEQAIAQTPPAAPPPPVHFSRADRRGLAESDDRGNIQSPGPQPELVAAAIHLR